MEPVLEQARQLLPRPALTTNSALTDGGRAGKPRLAPPGVRA
jgi:hypothetical protein